MIDEEQDKIQYIQEKVEDRIFYVVFEEATFMIEYKSHLRKIKEFIVSTTFTISCRVQYVNY